jgi:hypothetical protein
METALEHILISSYKQEMISFMRANPENFKEAIKLAGRITALFMAGSVVIM